MNSTSNAKDHATNSTTNNATNSALNPWLNTMVERIVKDFHPLQIILFGSHARGDATAHSDIDLLVVFPELHSKRETTVAIREVLADLPVAKDIVVTTPTEIEEYGDLVGRVLRPALREGKVIYASYPLRPDGNCLFESSGVNQ